MQKLFYCLIYLFNIRYLTHLCRKNTYKTPILSNTSYHFIQCHVDHELVLTQMPIFRGAKQSSRFLSWALGRAQSRLVMTWLCTKRRSLSRAGTCAVDTGHKSHSVHYSCSMLPLVIEWIKHCTVWLKLSWQFQLCSVSFKSTHAEDNLYLWKLVL